MSVIAKLYYSQRLFEGAFIQFVLHHPTPIYLVDRSHPRRDPAGRTLLPAVSVHPFEFSLGWFTSTLENALNLGKPYLAEKVA